MVPPLTATSKDVSCNIRNVNLLYFSRYAYFSSVYHHSLRVISYQPTMTKEQEYLGHNLPLVIPDVVLVFVTPAICNNYCLHKGECTQPESCTCPPGYRGKRCEICKCARKEEEVRTGYVHSIPDSFRAGIKIILERVSVHTQKTVWRRDFCDRAKLRRADLERGALHIEWILRNTLVQCEHLFVRSRM